MDRFSYFSGDEEFVGLLVHRIVNLKSWVLTSPSATLGFNLGPAFHYLTALFYIASGHAYQNLFYFGILAGGLTTVVIYFIGKEIHQDKIGIMAALVYAFSFLSGLADRRWWVHSFDPLFNALSIFFWLKIIAGKYIYIPLLALLITFGWNADPSYISIGVLSVILGIIFKKIRPPKKELLKAVMIILLSLFPIILFEFRHNFVSWERLQRFFVRSNISVISVNTPKFAFPWRWLSSLGGFISTPASHQAESFWCYCEEFVPKIYWRITYLVILTGIMLFSIKILLFPNSKSSALRNLIIILFCQVLVLSSGLLIFEKYFGGKAFPFYFIGAFPAMSLLFSIMVVKVFKKYGYWIAILGVSLNIISLLKSSFAIPFSQRIMIVQQIKNLTQGRPYRLIASGDGYVEGGGWKYLLLENGSDPAESYIDPVVGWLLPSKVEPKEAEIEIKIVNNPNFGPDQKYFSILAKHL